VTGLVSTDRGVSEPEPGTTSRSRLVDSHCHLNLLDPSRYEGGLESVIANARAAGVDSMLCVSVELESFPEVEAFARTTTGVFASAGVHPNEHPAAEPDPETLVALAAREHVVAIGETGLDYYRGADDAERQRARFRVHVAAARAAGLPLIVHCREAAEDTLRVLAEEGAREVGGVMHCFVQDWETARRAMDLGFYISFSGIVTFKNAQSLRAVAGRVPLDRLLVETDSPYLAPAPFRGKPNQPAYVRHVAEALAAIRGLPFETVAEATTRNLFELFPRAVSPCARGAPRAGAERQRDIAHPPRARLPVASRSPGRWQWRPGSRTRSTSPASSRPGCRRASPRSPPRTCPTCAGAGASARS